MSETINLHQVPETMTLHRALWAGRVISAFVVIALVADGAIQLFAPAQIASMLQETGFAMEATLVVGPIVLACAVLYAIAQRRRRRVRHVAGGLGALARLQGSQGRDRKLCRGAHQSSAAASGRPFVDGGEPNQRARDDHGLVASGARV